MCGDVLRQDIRAIEHRLSARRTVFVRVRGCIEGKGALRIGDAGGRGCIEQIEKRRHVRALHLLENVKMRRDGEAGLIIGVDSRKHILQRGHVAVEAGNVVVDEAELRGGGSSETHRNQETSY